MVDILDDKCFITQTNQPGTPNYNWKLEYNLFEKKLVAKLIARYKLYDKSGEQLTSTGVAETKPRDPLS